jgi:hypothetical protein
MERIIGHEARVLAATSSIIFMRLRAKIQLDLTSCGAHTKSHKKFITKTAGRKLIVLDVSTNGTWLRLGNMLNSCLLPKKLE